MSKYTSCARYWQKIPIATTQHNMMMLLFSLALILSTLLVASQESDSITYYIKPYGNSTCPQEPCMTLSEYAEENNVLARHEVILIFMTGTHVLDRKLTIDNSTIVQYSMIGEPSHLPRLKSVITCSDSAGSFQFFLANISSLQIKYLAFSSCRSGQTNKIQFVLGIFKSSIAMVMSSFQHNIVVTVLYLSHSNMTASNCSFTDNSGVDDRIGDVGVAIFSFMSSIMFTGSNTFVQNSGHNSGAAIALIHSTLVTKATKGQPAYYTTLGKHVPEDASISFLYNQITDEQFDEKINLHAGGGACIVAYSSNINIYGISYYVGNSAERNNLSYGGCIYSKYSNILVSDMGTFVGNRAAVGGAIYAEGGTLTMTGNIQFISNSAIIYGGAMITTQGAILCHGRCIYRGNSVLESGGSVHFSRSNVTINGSFIIDKSSAVEFGAALHITLSRILVNGEIVCYNSSAKQSYGSVISFISSQLDINGTLNVSQTNGSISAFMSNFTINGQLFVEGVTHTYGMLFVHSNMYMNGTVVIKNNVGSFASGLYLLNSTAVFQGDCIISQNTGTAAGGLLIDESTATFRNLDINLLQNSAADGGGIYLSPTSKLILNGSVKMYASGNKARYGGAIFVQNVEDYRYCLKSTDYLNQGLQNYHCFFQIIGQGRNISLVFNGNNASLAGNDLFGGRLEYCTMNYNSTQSGLDAFRSISSFLANSISDSSSISSVPMTVCFCKNDSLSCDQSNFTVYVQRGEIFKVPLVAVGQANGIVPAVIRTQFKLANLKHTGFGQNQAVQWSRKQCHPLTFALTSAEDYVELTIFADGLCRDIGESSRTITVHFLDCFVGFQLSHGECICHQQIQHLTNTCIPQSGKIRRSTNWWIGTYYSNGSFQGLITYPHCPFDYCRREEMFISLEYPDSQCALNRSGILCGACQHGLSLTLGGSECDKCDSAITTPIVLLVALIAGVVLVITLLVLRLNVAVGTINGLVFYANIVSVNKAVFFPAGDSNILTVFIAWLNLDLCIQKCGYSFCSRPIYGCC